MQKSTKPRETACLDYRLFLLLLLLHFDKPMTSFRIGIASANLAGKSHCDTVDSVKTNTVRCGIYSMVAKAIRRKSLSREESREVLTIIVDVVGAHSRSNLWNFNISMQNLFKLSNSQDFKSALCQKSEIGLERDQAHHLIVCAKLRRLLGRWLFWLYEKC